MPDRGCEADDGLIGPKAMYVKVAYFMATKNMKLA